MGEQEQSRQMVDAETEGGDVNVNVEQPQQPQPDGGDGSDGGDAPDGGGGDGDPGDESG